METKFTHDLPPSRGASVAVARPLSALARGKLNAAVVAANRLTIADLSTLTVMGTSSGTGRQLVTASLRHEWDVVPTLHAPRAALRLFSRIFDRVLCKPAGAPAETHSQEPEREREL